jgi:hypothetical protein
MWGMADQSRQDGFWAPSEERGSLWKRPERPANTREVNWRRVAALVVLILLAIPWMGDSTPIWLAVFSVLARVILLIWFVVLVVSGFLRWIKRGTS